jgi:hypothetical protein
VQDFLTGRPLHQQSFVSHDTILRRNLRGPDAG